MSTETNKRTARTLFEMVSAGAIDPEIFTDSFVLWAPMTGQEMSREQYFAGYEALRREFRTPFKIIVTGMVAEEDRVAVEGRSEGEFTTGEPYRNHYHFLLYFKDGKIARMHEHMDSKHVMDVVMPKLSVS